MDQGEQYPIITQTLTTITSSAGLMPLYLTVPSDLPTGSTVTLTNNQPGDDAVYSPGVGTMTTMTTLTSSTTWTIGTSPTVPSELYVAAVAGAGSTNVGDTVFTLSDAPKYSGAHPTTVGESVTTNPATNDPLEIISQNNPNAGNPTGNVDGKTLNWLVGQKVELEAMPTGPESLDDNSPYIWTVPGNVLDSIIEYKNHSERITVPYDGGPDFSDPGASRQQTSFFWVSSGQPTQETVKVRGALSSGQVTFDVYEPSATGQTYHGSFGVDDSDVGLIKPETVTVPGIGSASISKVIWTASVSTVQPSGVTAFSAGHAYYLQKVNNQSQYVNLSSVTYYARHFGEWVLDNSDPYHSYQPILTDGNMLVDSDKPVAPWFNDGGLVATDITLNAQYQTFVMYLPPGSASYAVPLLVLNWNGDARGTKTSAASPAQDIGPDNTNIPGNFEAALGEPEWMAVFHNDDPWGLDK